MSENIEVIVSPSGKYKATIIEKPDSYTIDIYELLEDYDHQNDVLVNDFWLRKSPTPLLVGKDFHAKAFAIDELRKLMNEPALPLSIDWVKDFSFCEDAIFINPYDVEVFSECIDNENHETKPDKIEAKTIISIMGLCLVEEVGCEDEWQMGQIDDSGHIICWANYGTLKEAIMGL